MEGFSPHSGDQMKEEDFRRFTQNIETNIQKISQNVSSMKRMVNQLSTPQDSPELRNQLHQIQHYTQQLAKDTSVSLKDLNNIPTTLPQMTQKHLKIQRERLAEQFGTTLNLFQTIQRDAAAKEKEQVQRARIVAMGDPFKTLSQGQPDDQQLIELQAGRKQAQAQEEIDLRALEEQEAAVRQLESDIQDVNKIFKELGAMVHEQGEWVDSIETSVERTTTFVHQGAQQLYQAGNYQNKLRKKKLILVIIATLILTVIVIIIAVKSS